MKHRVVLTLQHHMVTEMPHSATQMGKIFRARKTVALRTTIEDDTQTERI